MAQRYMTIDDLATTKAPTDNDLIAGRDSSGSDFQITVKNMQGGQNATGYKNYILDGDLNFWNDGTTFNAAGYNDYGPDVWFLNFGGVATTVTREDLIDSNVSKYFMRFDHSTTSANAFFGQKLKDANLLSNKNISAFIRLKSSTGLTTLSMQIEMNKAGSAQITNSSAQAIASDDTWTWYRFDITNPLLSGTINAGNYTRLIFLNGTNETWILDIDKVRVIETPPDLEDGDIPEWIKDDEDPMAAGPLVKQYYIKMVGDASTWGTFAYGRGSSGSFVGFTVPISNEMIQTPSITQSNAVILNISAGVNIALGGSENITNEKTLPRFNSFRFNDPSSPFIVNRGYHMEFDNTGYLEMDARY